MSLRSGCRKALAKPLPKPLAKGLFSEIGLYCNCTYNHNRNHTSNYTGTSNGHQQSPSSCDRIHALASLLGMRARPSEAFSGFEKASASRGQMTGHRCAHARTTTSTYNTEESR